MGGKKKPFNAKTIIRTIILQLSCEYYIIDLLNKTNNCKGDPFDVDYCY